MDIVCFGNVYKFLKVISSEIYHSLVRAGLWVIHDAVFLVRLRRQRGINFTSKIL